MVAGFLVVLTSLEELGKSWGEDLWGMAGWR
jgi:hypothetical protein